MLSNKKIVMILMVIAVVMVFMFRKDDRKYLLGTYNITSFANIETDLENCKLEITKNGKITFFNDAETIFEAYITKYKKNTIKLAVKDKDKYHDEIFGNSQDVFSVEFNEENNNLELKYNDKIVDCELES